MRVSKKRFEREKLAFFIGAIIGFPFSLWISGISMPENTADPEQFKKDAIVWSDFIGFVSVLATVAFYAKKDWFGAELSGGSAGFAVVVAGMQWILRATGIIT
ncbi:MAG TPA: hypothetical protein VJP79_03175 [Nitrososphaera sp.]|nr:hypothetical protein [Nitrososphaera sp.]